MNVQAIPTVDSSGLPLVWTRVGLTRQRVRKIGLLAVKLPALPVPQA